MKYKLFVCVNGNKSLIASSNDFSDFQKLIEELDNSNKIFVTDESLINEVNFCYVS